MYHLNLQVIKHPWNSQLHMFTSKSFYYYKFYTLYAQKDQKLVNEILSIPTKIFNIYK